MALIANCCIVDLNDEATMRKSYCPRYAQCSGMLTLGQQDWLEHKMLAGLPAEKQPQRALLMRPAAHAGLCQM